MTDPSLTPGLLEDVTRDDITDVFEYWRKNPIIASRDLLGVDLPPHQRLALRSAWLLPDVIQVWTRGGGKTWFLALFAALSAALYPAEKIGIFGPSYRQAKFVWAELEKIYDNAPKFQEMCIKKPSMSNEKCHLKLLNNSIIEALPLGDGGKIRGARYFRILVDEAAQIPDDVLDIVIGGMRATHKNPMDNVRLIEHQRRMIAKGLMREDELLKPPKNKLLLASTAFYRFNHLWDRVQIYKERIQQDTHLNPKILVPNKVMWNDERALLMFDRFDPPEGFMDMQSIEENRLKMSDLKFAMEYMCYFPPDSHGFYRRSVIEKARGHNKFTVELEGSIVDNFVIGVDVARTSDNFAVAIGRLLSDNSVELVRVITLNNRTFTEMHDVIRECIDTYKNIMYMCMDTGGGGTSIQDNLMDSRMCPEGQKLIYDSINNPDYEDFEGWHWLEMIKFSDDSIPKMAYQLQADLDHDRFKFPSLPSTYLRKGTTDAFGNTLADLERHYVEIEETIEETTSIVVQATRTGRMHLGLPGEISKAFGVAHTEKLGMRAPRKDRWTAIMLMNWAAFKVTREEQVAKVDELAGGFSMYNVMQSNSPVPTHHILRQMKARGK